MTERVVAITGGNRGLGRELARQCAADGDTVLLGSRDVAGGERVAAELNASGPAGRVLPVRLDVTDQAGLAELAGRIGDEFGRLHVLVNNAAIHYDTWQTSTNADLPVVREALETNVLGAWRTTLALLPLLRRASRAARIVMVSSEGGSLTSMGGGLPAYHVSKAALNALTLTMAGDLRREGILVNAVCPGWTATDMGGPGGRPVSAGAASIRYAMDLPDGGPTGTFTRDGQPVPW